MTEGQVQGKWVLLQNNGDFEITEFELAGSNCIYVNYWEVAGHNIKYPR